MVYRNHTMEEDEFEYYIFKKNLQGDIVAVYDEYGSAVVTYTYDAWGNVSEYVYDTTSNGQYNSFRYRGYFYDEETGLYYLNSRYYDPATGRFLNADVFINANGDLVGFNMYAYCSNNPIRYVDFRGCKKVEYMPWHKLSSPGEIHNAVVKHISEKMGYIAEKYVNGNKLRYDLRNGFMVYEVKPVTYRRGFRLLGALLQLDRYIEALGEGYGRGDFIEGFEFPYKDFTIRYWYEGQGIILYEFWCYEDDDDDDNDSSGGGLPALDRVTEDKKSSILIPSLSKEDEVFAYGCVFFGATIVAAMKVFGGTSFKATVACFA